MQLFDSHCHFDDAWFDEDRDLAYERAVASGVREIVLPAITAASWPKLKAVAERYAGLHPSYGLHPMLLAEHQPEHLEALGDWLAREQAVAVGECGLDFYVENLDRAAQIDYFVGQLDLAARFDLPVIIHARKAVDTVTKYLRQYAGLRGVVHSFSGSEQQALQLIDLGFYLSFGGPITYPRAKRLRRLAASLPLDAVLIETDAPDQPDVEHRGQRNEPAFLPIVVRELAQLRESDPEAIAQATTQNARRLFGLNAKA